MTIESNTDIETVVKVELEVMKVLVGNKLAMTKSELILTMPKKIEFASRYQRIEDVYKNWKNRMKSSFIIRSNSSQMWRILPERAE